MDNEKIGKLITFCRKKKGLTQKALAEKLGVSDKAVSKWECGTCLPDVSLYRDLCDILGISLNEFFSGELLSSEEFIKAADDNLMILLKDSSFTLKERIEYFKEKWQKDHFWSLTILMVIIVFFIIYGFIKDNKIQYLFMILGFIIGVIENNKMLAYIEKNAYGQKALSLSDFKCSLARFKEVKSILEGFKTKEEAIEYLVKETGLSSKECAESYNILMKIDWNMIK